LSLEAEPALVPAEAAAAVLDAPVDEPAPVAAEVEPAGVEPAEVVPAEEPGCAATA
jgi:hypothetical protein